MKYLLVILFFYNLSMNSASALMPRRHSWIELKTEHFTIVAPKEYKGFARDTAFEAERAFETLKAISNQFPKNTIIIIDPTKDYSNGQATFFPYATITIQPAAPSPSTSIGQYDNWLYELLLHEYTHILSFHNHRGAYRPLRWLLGSTISPGYFLPVWYLEGFAVYTESTLTSGGRLKTSRYRALEELFSTESKKIHISNINEQDLLKYPFGQNPYFFGGVINKKMLKDKDAAKNIHKKFSGRIPFFIASAYKNIAKKSIYKTWRNFFKKNKTPEKVNKDLIGENPVLHKNKVYFIGQDSYQSATINEHNPISGKTRTIVMSTGSSRNISQFKIVGEDIYLLSMNKRQNEFQVFELFKAKVKDKEERDLKPLTKMLRARHFDILKDQVIYSEININGDKIALTNLNDLEKREVVYSGNEKKRSRISFPFFISKNEIIFAEKKSGEDESIFKYNIKTKSKEKVFTDQHINYLSLKKDKIHILSEANGVKRFSSIGKSEKSYNISNSVTTIDVSGSNVWASRLSLQGPVISKLNKDNKSLFGIKKSQQRFISSVKDETEDELSRKTQNSEPDKVTTKETKYSSLHKIKPHYITPNFVLSPYGFSGESLYGLSTGGSDPLKLNSYSINVFTDSITNEVSGTFNYLSQHLVFPISVSAGKFFEPISLDSVRDSSFAQISTVLNVSPNSFLGWNIGGGFLWDETNFGSVKANRAGANLNISYISARQRARELAPTNGLQFTLSGTFFSEVDESYTSYSNLESNFRTYLKSPLNKSHRLLIGADASFSDDLLLQTYAPFSRNNPLSRGFTLRGIPTGAIQALEFYAIGHLEYRFPILRFDWGPGLWPIFLKRATGAIVSDFGVVSGANRIIGKTLALDTDQFLSSAGLEFTLETKISYHAPLNFQFGIYNFLNEEVYDAGPEVFIGVNLDGFPF